MSHVPVIRRVCDSCWWIIPWMTVCSLAALTTEHSMICLHMYIIYIHNKEATKLWTLLQHNPQPLVCTSFALFSRFVSYQPIADEKVKSAIGPAGDIAIKVYQGRDGVDRHFPSMEDQRGRMHPVEGIVDLINMYCTAVTQTAAVLSQPELLDQKFYHRPLSNDCQGSLRFATHSCSRNSLGKIIPELTAAAGLKGYYTTRSAMVSLPPQLRSQVNSGNYPGSVMCVSEAGVGVTPSPHHQSAARDVASHHGTAARSTPPSAGVTSQSQRPPASPLRAQGSATDTSHTRPTTRTSGTSSGYTAEMMTVNPVRTQSFEPEAKRKPNGHEADGSTASDTEHPATNGTGISHPPVVHYHNCNVTVYHFHQY